MISYQVKLSESLEYFGKRGSRVTFKGFGPRVAQMTALGQSAIDSIQRRLDHGVGSSDAAMPPLKDRYRQWKERIGLGGIRNLTGPGMAMQSVTARGPDGKRRRTGEWKRVSGKGNMHMLDDVRITSVSETQVRIAITNAYSRLKASANERRSPWFGFSPRDMQFLERESKRIFQANVDSIRARFNLPRAA